MADALAKLAVDSRTEATPAEVAQLSRSLLDVSLTTPGLLVVRALRGGEPLLSVGAFDRASRLGAQHLEAPEPRPAIVGRGSGGIPVHFDLDSLWIGLAMESTTAFTDATPATLVNRHVRPLLRALAREKVPASYGGRDWIASVKTPVAWVGFQHDARTQRAAFEAVVALRKPFASAERVAFLGKTPLALDAVAGRTVDPLVLRNSVIEAYISAFSALPEERAVESMRTQSDRSADDPPFSAVVSEAIGIVGAGPTKQGYVGVGGEFAGSRDAVAAFNYRLTQIDWRDAAALDEAISEAFDHPNMVIDGVRTLSSFKDVILRSAT